jgi:hypothetical protein
LVPAVASVVRELDPAQKRIVVDAAVLGLEQEPESEEAE